MRKHRAFFSTVALMGVASFLIAADAPTSQPSKTVTASGLTIVETGQDSAVATATAKAGDQVWVDYTGKLTDGTTFDASSIHPDQPIVFVLGQHHVIPGWEEGIVGMKSGD